MLILKACSETTLFTECSDEVFHSLELRRYISYDHHLFLKMFKILCRFQKLKKKLRKFFQFSDNCIWIGSCKLSQSSTGYLSSAVNVLTNSPKISPIIRGEISKSTSLRMMKKHDKSALMEISEVFGTLSQVYSQSVFWNGAF